MVIVDQLSMGVISSCCTMTEIVSEMIKSEFNVTRNRPVKFAHTVGAVVTPVIKVHP